MIRPAGGGGGGKRAKNSVANSVDGGSGAGQSPYFINKKIKYVWDSSLLMFTKLQHLDIGMRQSDFHKYVTKICIGGIN